MTVRRVDKVLLYDEGVAEELNMKEIAEYLTEKLEKVRVEMRGSPFASRLEKDPDCARKLASIKVQDVNRKMALIQEPLYGEVSYEKRRMQGKTKAFGVIYDGLQLQRAFAELIPRDERSLGVAHIFFTNRLFATWDDGDKRYHLRASVYSIPSIVSTSGLIEAPARPREYYLLKQQHGTLGKDLTEVKDRFKGSFIDYGDERLTEVVKGYAMQALFYSLTGEPFCDDTGCRLYNAHWQEELIFAQLESGYEFCRRHIRLLRRSKVTCG